MTRFSKLELPDRFFRSAIFSGEAESSVIQEHFKDSLPGFFVDIGANDPVVHSQTYALEQRGWTGVLVEPLPDKASELRVHRRAQVFELACSAPADDGKLLTLHVAGSFSSLQRQRMTAGISPRCEITVEGATLDRILRSANAPTPINFVSIDVEGHELAVLTGFDLQNWRPALLLIEDHALDLELHRYMKAHGYSWFRRTGLNSWFAPSAVAPAIGWFGKWQYLRKHYFSLPFRHIREIKRRKFNKPIDVT
jgi:FkbM family methyltransferase